MAGDSPGERQRILLVTGMLGAGKSTALRELEDLGWEAIDNFPIRLLHRPQCRNRVGVDELIDVGPAELQDDRSRRKFRLETLDRSGAAPSMNGHHRVGRLSVKVRCDPHPVPELPQDARPSRRRDAVASA